MKNFTILLTVLALTALISCSGTEEAMVYGGYDDDADTSSQSDTDDSTSSSDTDADKTDTADSTDTADTANTEPTDTADSTDSEDPNTTDTGADTTDTGADTANTGADTTDTSADTTDTGADTANTGADTANTGADTADTGADTANTGADTSADTGDTESCIPNCEGKVCGNLDGCGGKCDACEEGKFCNYEYKCIPTECATVTEINLNTSLELDTNTSYSPQSARFKTSYTPNTGTDAKDTFFIKFSNLDTYKGTFYLENKNFGDPSGFFLYVEEDGGVKKYFQKDGTVTTDYNDEDDGWWKTETISAKLTGVILEEVNIDENNHSTPATGGACLKVKNTTLEFESDSNGWVLELLEAIADLFGDGWY